jgi:hypothetical protein
LTDTLIKSKKGKAKSKIYVVCCDPSFRGAILSRINPRAVIVEMPSAAKQLPAVTADDVVIVCTPADIAQWRLSARLGATAAVVICNGLFANGYTEFQPVYYFKPISGKSVQLSLVEHACMQQYSSMLISSCIFASTHYSELLGAHV